MLGSLVILASFVAISTGQQNCHRVWEEITEMRWLRPNHGITCYQFENPTCRWIYHPDVQWPGQFTGQRTLTTKQDVRHYNGCQSECPANHHPVVVSMTGAHFLTSRFGNYECKDGT